MTSGGDTALLIFLVNFVSPPYATWDESVWESVGERGRRDDGQYVPAGYEGREGGDFCESLQTTKVKSLQTLAGIRLYPR